MMKKPRTIISTLSLLLILSTHSFSINADVEWAVQALENGDYNYAYRELRSLATQGNSSAQNNLGFMYAKGLGITKDYDQALYWFKKAAQQGNQEAKNNIQFILKKIAKTESGGKETVVSTNTTEPQKNETKNTPNSSSNTVATETKKNIILPTTTVLSNMFSGSNILPPVAISSLENKKTAPPEKTETTKVASLKNAPVPLQEIPKTKAEIESILKAEKGSVYAGEIFDYTVSRSDTLPTLTARFAIDRKVLPTSLVPGQRIRINNRHIIPKDKTNAKVVVNLPQRMLFVKKKETGTIDGYPVGVGKFTTPSPTTTVSIVSIRKNPTWHVPPSIQEEMRSRGREVVASVAPGKDNPLGKYWIGLSASGYGIHGTNRPTSIYGRVSHGCIRMDNNSIEEVRNQISVGDTAKLIYEPVLLAVSAEGDILLEVHDDVYQKKGDLFKLTEQMAKEQGISQYIDWNQAKKVLKTREGVAREVGKLPNELIGKHNEMARNGYAKENGKY